MDATPASESLKISDSLAARMDFGVNVGTTTAPSALTHTATTDGWLTRSTHLPASSGAWTVAVWARGDVLAADSIFSFQHTVGPDWILFLQSSGNRVVLYAPNDTFAVADMPPVGSWHHYAVASDGTNARLYIDGDYKTQIGVPAGKTCTNVWVGADTYGNFWGALSAFKLWDATLTPDQIQAEMVSKVPVFLTNLNSYLPLDSGSFGDEQSANNWDFSINGTIVQDPTGPHFGIGETLRASITVSAISDLGSVIGAGIRITESATALRGDMAVSKTESVRLTDTGQGRTELTGVIHVTDSATAVMSIGGTLSVAKTETIRISGAATAFRVEPPTDIVAVPTTESLTLVDASESWAELFDFDPVRISESAQAQLIAGGGVFTVSEQEALALSDTAVSRLFPLEARPSADTLTLAGASTGQLGQLAAVASDHISIDSAATGFRVEPILDALPAAERLRVHDTAGGPFSLGTGDHWITQARAGIARAGVTRANGIIPNLVVTLAGVDITRYVMNVSITQELNDLPDTARLTLRPGAPTPAIGHAVIIGIGTAENAEFGGQVVRFTRRRLMSNTTVLCDLECLDWLRLFDRRLITYEYHSTSATDIVKDIILNYTSGFDDRAVMPGLTLTGTDSIVPLVNARPSEALRTVATLLGPGAGFYIDANRVVHFFGPAGETDYKPTSPLPLTDSLTTLKDFSIRYDGTQIRTRVRAEHRETSAPLGVPAGFVQIPVVDASVFEEHLSPPYGFMRIGDQAVRYGAALTYADFFGNRPGTTVTADVAAGANTIPIVTTAPWGVAAGYCFAKIGDQIIYGNMGQTGTESAITNVPSAGYGSIAAPIKSGDAVTTVDRVSIAFADTVFDAPRDVAVVPYVQLDDTAAQTLIASIEGGDGIHEEVIGDGRVNEDTATLLAQSELDHFADPLVTAEWETEDMNARPGRVQTITFGTVPEELSAQLQIIRAEVTWTLQNYPPRRRCASATVKVAGLLEMLTDLRMRDVRNRIERMTGL